MRGTLVEFAPNYEQRYFQDRIAQGKISLTGAITWLQPYFKPVLSSCSSSQNYLTTYLSAFVELLVNGSDAAIPSTFKFDLLRISHIRRDIRDLQSFEMCFLLFKSLSGLSSNEVNSSSSQHFALFRRELGDIVGCETSDRLWEGSLESVALHIATRSYQIRHGLNTTNSHDIQLATLESLTSLCRGWLTRHILQSNPENRKSDLSAGLRQRTIRHLSSLSPCDENVEWTFGLTSELEILRKRVVKLAEFHWTVLGQVYLAEIAAAM